MVQNRGDEVPLATYRVRLPYHLVGPLFETAVLILGVGASRMM